MVSAWLATTCILDLANTRTQWLVKENTGLATTYTLAISFKAVCLLAETIEKHAWLNDAASYSPEELASPLKRIVFGWAYPLLGRGFKLVLSMDNLLPISADLKSNKTLESMPRQWFYRMMALEAC